MKPPPREICRRCRRDFSKKRKPASVSFRAGAVTWKWLLCPECRTAIVNAIFHVLDNYAEERP